MRVGVPRHFLRLADRTPEEHRALLARARALKAARRPGRREETLAGRTLGLLFEKPSTRTRVSFEVAMIELGGAAVTLPAAESQLPRGETAEDTARVLSRYLHGIVLRTFGDDRLAAFARAATVPVINGLSDGAHPVQLLADVFTLHERFGRTEGLGVAFLGDGAGNVARSWIEAARLFGFTLRLAAPEGFRPPGDEAAAAGEHLSVTDRPAEAVQGADVIATDVWTHMGREAEQAARRAALAPFAVTGALAALAAPNHVILHCLPAHRGEEIAAAVLDGPHSAVLDEAENRLHVQKALLEETIG